MPSSKYKSLLPAVLLLAVLLLAYRIQPAAAHIEKGPMPDSVAEMEYRILLEFEPDNIEVRNKLGMVLYRRGKLADAETEFRYVLDKAPGNFNAIDALGLVYMQRSDYNLAVDQFKKAIAINPDDMLVYYHLGQTLEKTGDLAAAAAAYNAGLARDVKDSPDKQIYMEQRQQLTKALLNIQDRTVTSEDSKQ